MCVINGMVYVQSVLGYAISYRVAVQSMLGLSMQSIISYLCNQWKASCEINVRLSLQLIVA